jgi:hypothetical protein
MAPHIASMIRRAGWRSRRGEAGVRASHGRLIPRTLIVSPEGEIVYSQTGFLDEDMAGRRVAL